MDMSRGHFSHIFIDEAAQVQFFFFSWEGFNHSLCLQALESETLIPLSLANQNTKIVLAGDHMQLDPPVYSKIARKYGLHVSLLERLYDSEAFESGVGQLCKTLLTENHRSHRLVSLLMMLGADASIAVVFRFWIFHLNSFIRASWLARQNSLPLALNKVQWTSQRWSLWAWRGKRNRMRIPHRTSMLMRPYKWKKRWAYRDCRLSVGPS